MKKISSVLILFLLIFKTSLADTYSSDPKVFVQELINDSISKLSDKDLTKEQKKKFIEEVALKYVDIDALGLYTLGELRKSSEKKDLANYIFTKIVSHSFFFCMKGYNVFD